MNVSGLNSKVAALMIIGASHTMHAAAADLSGAYLGGNFGRARNGYDTGFIDGQIESAAMSAGAAAQFTARSMQRMSDIWWADAGYFLNPYIGVDAAFIHLGEIKYVAVGNVSESSGDQPLSTANEITSHGPALSLILRLPLTEALAGELRVGDYFGRTILDSSIAVGSNSSFMRASNSGSSLLAGAGAAYSIDAHWSVRIDYLRVNRTGDSNSVGKYSVNAATVGVSYTL